MSLDFLEILYGDRSHQSNFFAKNLSVLGKVVFEIIKLEI